MSTTSTLPPRQGNVAAVIQNGGMGAAIGIVVVITIPYLFPNVSLTPEIASMLTGAIGTIAGYFLRYLPKPPN